MNNQAPHARIPETQPVTPEPNPDNMPQRSGAPAPPAVPLDLEGLRVFVDKSVAFHKEAGMDLEHVDSGLTIAQASALLSEIESLRSQLEYVRQMFKETDELRHKYKLEVASLRSDRERRREWLEQPITKVEKERAYEYAKELAREQVNGTISIQHLYIGVDAAWEYCEALVEATNEMWRMEVAMLKGRLGEDDE